MLLSISRMPDFSHCFTVFAAQWEKTRETEKVHAQLEFSFTVLSSLAPVVIPFRFLSSSQLSQLWTLIISSLLCASKLEFWIQNQWHTMANIQSIMKHAGIFFSLSSLIIKKKLGKNLLELNSQWKQQQKKVINENEERAFVTSLSLLRMSFKHRVVKFELKSCFFMKILKLPKTWRAKHGMLDDFVVVVMLSSIRD